MNPTICIVPFTIERKKMLLSTGVIDLNQQLHFSLIVKIFIVWFNYV